MTDRRWTILEIIDWTKKRFEQESIPTPRLDAEVLLAHALQTDRMRLYLEHDRPLQPAELSEYRQWIKRRLAREPIAYILGEREFFSLPFHVDQRVLVPRPETELLVELAANEMKDKKSFLVADAGTGSGAIAIALASEMPGAIVIAIDDDQGALDVAKTNIERHGLEGRITLQSGDMLKNVAPESLDLALSNPPYLTEAEWEGAMPEVKVFEPKHALASGEDGFDTIRRLIPQALLALKPGGVLLFEIGATQGKAALELVQGCKAFVGCKIHRDLAGLDRIVQATKTQGQK